MWQGRKLIGVTILRWAVNMTWPPPSPHPGRDALSCKQLHTAFLSSHLLTCLSVSANDLPPSYGLNCAPLYSTSFLGKRRERVGSSGRGSGVARRLVEKQRYVYMLMWLICWERKNWWSERKRVERPEWGPGTGEEPQEEKDLEAKGGGRRPHPGARKIPKAALPCLLPLI